MIAWIQRLEKIIPRTVTSVRIISSLRDIEVTTSCRFLTGQHLLYHKHRGMVVAEPDRKQVAR